MAVVERPVYGGECKLYYNTATNASPTWALITRAIDVSDNLTMDDVDASSRVSDWKAHLAGQKDLEITFTYRKKQGTDTIFAALVAAATAKTQIQFAVMDGLMADTGVQGIKAYCQIQALNDTQNLTAAQEVSFTLKPTYYEVSGTLVEPTWLIVA